MRVTAFASRKGVLAAPSRHDNRLGDGHRGRAPARPCISWRHDYWLGETTADVLPHVLGFPAFDIQMPPRAFTRFREMR